MHSWFDHSTYIGLSEGTGPVTTSAKEARRLGSVGKAFEGMEIKIDNPDPLTEERYSRNAIGD